jgi:hypothetical protein
MLPLGSVISRHGLSYHCYADDTQLYLRTTPTPSCLLPTSTLTTCLEGIEAWIKRNFLQFNSSKTEAILIGTPPQLCSSHITSSGATVHGFPVIRTDQPSRFGTQVIRGSADKKKKLCVDVISACLEDNSGINNIFKYRSEIQFLLCFIWRSVNPIET